MARGGSHRDANRGFSLHRLHVDGSGSDFPAAQRRVDSEITKKTKSGGEILVHTRCTLVRNREGDAKSVLSISSDITEKKRMEEELFRAQRLESIGLLAGGIAHDLKNVLTPIMMGAKILQEELPAAEKTEVLNVIKSCAQRGADMVSRILSFARGAGGKPVPVRIEEIMGEVLNLVWDHFRNQCRPV